MSVLLKPLKIGSVELKNRIIMAPLTRSRATGADGRTPNDLMLKYYVQRADAGLIITEATAVTPMGVGYDNTPGIWSEEQVEGWKKITDAIHDRGGKIFLQLWHVGRISHPYFLKGERPVAPSAIAAQGFVSLVRPQIAYEVPRALEKKEIAGVVEEFRKGADKVGMHLAPRGDSHSVGDSNLELTFSYVVQKLSDRKIAFICTRESLGADSLSPKLRKLFKGAFIANEKFTIESAEDIVSKGDADAVAFGKDFIATPDLVKRVEQKLPLNPVHPETFYAKGEVGYTDYPILTE